VDFTTIGEDGFGYLGMELNLKTLENINFYFLRDMEILNLSELVIG
jgi:hypothetical protein